MIILIFLHRWPHVRKQQYVADRRRIGEQHRQPIDADALTRGRRHADFERGDEIFVEMLGFFVASLAFFSLLQEALALIGGLAYKALQNYSQGKPVISSGNELPAPAPRGSGSEGIRSHRSPVVS